MGQVAGTLTTRDINLNQDDLPTFPPDYGFSGKRKQRVMVADEKSLQSARIPPKYRDYCAHHLLDYQICRYKEMPMLYRCAHEKHNYLNCEQEDYVLRMKEFEREKRLRRLQQKGLGVAAA